MGDLNVIWVEPDIRDNIISFVDMIASKTEITKTRPLNLIGIYSNKYYEWVNREGQPNKHNGIIPKLHWILP